jgi:hypothetical protein
VQLHTHPTCIWCSNTPQTLSPAPPSPATGQLCRLGMTCREARARYFVLQSRLRELKAKNVEGRRKRGALETQLKTSTGLHCLSLVNVRNCVPGTPPGKGCCSFPWLTTAPFAPPFAPLARQTCSSGASST